MKMSPVASPKIDILQHPRLEQLTDALGVTVEDVSELRHLYNNHMNRYGNEIYEKNETRVVHWQNFLEAGWFTKRLGIYEQPLSEYSLIVDLGFSIPHPYLIFDPETFGKTRFLFVDKENSAKSFFDAYIDLASIDYRSDLDQVLIEDIDHPASRANILSEISHLSPERVLVVLSEVIEHLEDPDNVFDLLGGLSKMIGRKNVDIYLTLPIGEKIPSHNTVFLTIDAARQFVRQRLDIAEDSYLQPGPQDTPIRLFSGIYCAFGQLSARRP